MILRKDPYVAYYKTSEDLDEKDDNIVAMPSANPHVNNLNKQTDDHQMTGGINDGS